MKKVIWCILAISSFFYANAQDVIISDPISVASDHRLGLIGEIKGQPLMFRWKEHDYRVMGFNKNLQKKFEKKLELEKRLPTVLFVEASKNDFSVIYYHRQKGHLYLRANKYDANVNLLDSVLIADLGKVFFTPRFHTEESKDKNILLLHYMQNEEIVNAFCYQLDAMKLLWKKKFKPDNYFREQSFFQMQVSNRGEMFMILKRNNINTRRRPHKYTILSYHAGQGEVASFDISMEGHTTYDAVFEYDNLNKQLVGGGFYSVKNGSRANGWFYLRWKPESEEKTLLKFHEFDQTFVADFMNNKRVRKNATISNIQIREPVLRRDGGMLLIAEKVTVYNQQNTNQMGRPRSFGFPTSPGIDYYYEEILLLSIHPDGRLHWSNILRKKQISHSDGAVGSSFFLTKTKKKLHFIYNRDIQRSTLISEYLLSGDGGFAENNIISTEGLKSLFRFRDALQVSSKDVLVWSHWRTRLRLARITFE